MRSEELLIVVSPNPRMKVVYGDHDAAIYGWEGGVSNNTSTFGKLRDNTQSYLC